MHRYKVIDLVKMADIPRSTYYHWVKQMNRSNKYGEEKQAIQQIFEEDEGLYSYRRITLALRKKVFGINHKIVLRLMNEMGLKYLVRMRKYRSYRGEVGKAAPNL